MFCGKNINKLIEKIIILYRIKLINKIIKLGYLKKIFKYFLKTIESTS